MNYVCVCVSFDNENAPWMENLFAFSLPIIYHFSRSHLTTKIQSHTQMNMDYFQSISRSTTPCPSFLSDKQDITHHEGISHVKYIAKWKRGVRKGILYLCAQSRMFDAAATVNHTHSRCAFSYTENHTKSRLKI